MAQAGAPTNGEVRMTGKKVLLGKATHPDGSIRVVVAREGIARFVHAPVSKSPPLTTILHSNRPIELASELFDKSKEEISLRELHWHAPIDHQEVWAAGVTYLRSSEARQRESQDAAVFYDKVYAAPRPELFMKASSRSVKGPGQDVRFRSDSRWSVPEPEFALIINPVGDIVGITIGNDMSARDIEGENPLYLPQAKVYRGACSIGPYIILGPNFSKPAEWQLEITIERQGKPVFAGSTAMDRMKRTPSDLVSWLTREQDYPDGVILLTGTGIVPPDDFTLARGDLITIRLGDMATLTNPVTC